MTTNQKILITTIAIFSIFAAILVLGAFFGVEVLHPSVLLVIGLLVLFLVLLLLLFKKERKPLSKEEQAKRHKFGGIFFLGYGIIYLILPFVFGDEVRLFHYITAIGFIIAGIGFLWWSYRLKNENTN